MKPTSGLYIHGGDDQQAILMHLRRMIGDVEKLSDDILTADRKTEES